MSRPSQGTVEDLIAALGSVAPAGIQNFELWIPRELTLRGKPTSLDMAMAIVLDKILGMGFTAEKDGRIYRYKIMT